PAPPRSRLTARRLRIVADREAARAAAPARADPELDSGPRSRPPGTAERDRPRARPRARARDPDVCPRSEILPLRHEERLPRALRSRRRRPPARARGADADRGCRDGDRADAGSEAEARGGAREAERG